MPREPRAAPLPRGLAPGLRRPRRVRRRPGFVERPARRAALRRVRGRSARALIEPSTRRRARSRRQAAGDARRRRRHQRVGHARRLDDEPDRDRPLGQRRRLHVHDRADRRQRHGRAGLRLPAQQRADRLQPRQRTGTSPGGVSRRQPGRGRQAPALVDRADDRPARRQAVPRARLARRRDDHHDRPADPAQPPRLRHDAAGGDRGAAPSQRNAATTQTRGGVPRPRRQVAALAGRGQKFT